ncbi:hypothetical protein NM208_g6256 [Fusarium decemcellulare]|uniref:Uncharacterized protein n=1 Tax=Fusarium decemcellulare TaxID=57161 RepID=A0ACC1SDQ1_9HYPO|nr:hypothetical protein NM208_g6256 [Fusarium decemcellulare]
MSFELSRRSGTEPRGSESETPYMSSLAPTDRGPAAWKFLFGCFIIEGVLWGFPMAFGVFQEHYSHLPEFAGSSNIAAIGTVSSSIYFLGAPFATPMVKRFQRWQYHMVLVGTATCILSLLGASFAPSVNVLIATQGVLYGSGFLLLYFPLLSMLNEWFVQRRGFAYAIVYAGGGFSGIGLPFLFEWLLSQYGFRTALRIFVVVQVVLLAPVLPLLRGRLPVADRSTLQRIDLSFLKNPFFWVLTISNLSQSFAYYIPSLYLPTFASFMGLSGPTGALVLAAHNLATVVGQLSFGYLSDRVDDICVLVIITTVVSSIATFTLWGFAHSITPLVMFAIIYGLFAGAYVVFWPRFGSMVSDDPQPIYSLMAFGKGVGNIVTAPVSESLLDKSLSSSYGSPRVSRRNARRPACAPCRARKLACDRSQPMCSPCRKARSKLNCIYPSTSPPKDLRPASASSPTTNAASEMRSQSTAKAMVDTSSGSGYFGYTSHNNVFEETQFNLFLANGTQQLGNTEDIEESCQKVVFHELRSPLRESALFVLRCLAGRQMTFEQHPRHPKGWPHIAIEGIMQSLRAKFKERSRQGDVSLSTLAELLCNNSRRPIKEENSDASQMIDQFCGQNLRWESIGLLWAYIARVSDDVDSLRSHCVESSVDQGSLETAEACLGYCIELAREFTEGNDVLLDLCRRKSVLDSIMDGDARISSYVSHSLAVTMLTYIGLHNLENGPSYQPTISSEYRRRLVAQIFTTDKFGVSFSGRPPLLTNNFCSTPMPLDIGDEDLASDGATLMRAFNSLDDHGWNTAGEIYPTTIIRARYMIAIIRDDLINIALCNRKPVDLSQLQNTKDQLMTSMSTLPEVLRYNPDDLNDPNVDAQALYFRITIQLDHDKNFFLAERLLIRHGQLDKSDLLLTSFEMVKLTVELWNRQSSFGNTLILREFEWLLLEYGAPAGGILCQELLQPITLGSHARYAGLTRSAIVQQLSMLVGFLDWVPLSAPSGKSCANFKRLIQCVLDYHLNDGAELEGRGDLGTLDWGSLLSPIFRFDLLNSFDWLGPDVV